MKRLVLVGIIVLVVATLPVAAHGNSIEADTQTSTDGMVTIELLTVVTDGFVVLHEAEGDEIGPVVGYTSPGEGPIHTELTVNIGAGYWQNVTNHTTLYVVLHRNEGDSSFNPQEDPMQESASGSLVATKFTVGKTEGNRSVVLAETDHAEEVNSSTVTVRRVELATDGYLVIRANDDGNPGEIVGHTALSAGTHHDVQIDFDEHFYSHQDERFSLWAVVHRSEGDGTFDPESDRAVTVNNTPVQTQFSLHRTDEVEDHDHGTATPTPASSDHHEEAHTHTPTKTDIANPTTSPPTDTPAITTTSETPEAPATETTTVQSPGFTFGIGLFALFTVLIVARRWP